MVGNNQGVRISIDAEANQPTFFSATGAASNVSDVQFTSDGNEAWAACGGKLYRSTDLANNFLSFTISTPTTAAARAQIAISTVDANGDYIIYGSFTNSSGCLVGVWKSENKGSTWTQIAFAGGSDPFAQPSGGALAS